MKKYTILFLSILIFSPLALQAREDGDDEFVYEDIKPRVYNIEIEDFSQPKPPDYGDHQKKDDSEEKVAEEKTEPKKDETIHDEFKNNRQQKEEKQEVPDSFWMAIIKCIISWFGV